MMEIWETIKTVIIILLVALGPAILAFLAVQAFFAWWFQQ